MTRVLASPSVTLGASAGAAVAVAWFFTQVWHASSQSVVYNVPIAIPFAAIFFDRLFPAPARPRTLALDAAVIGLALLRVFAPPLPFVSGHALFVGYAALSARRWPLRFTALAVLGQVIYFKLFVMGGWLSLVAGLLAAAVAAHLHQRWLIAHPRLTLQNPNAAGNPQLPAAS
ncbi:MAG TPA: hypothetical protein VGG33_05240 [Polyangia bacterium]